jgi:hypothetical protein
MVIYLIVCQTASDSGRLEMRLLVRQMPNLWTVSIDWMIDPRRTAALLRGKWILVGARDAKLLHPEVKRGPLDSQTCGRPVGT